MTNPFTRRWGGGDPLWFNLVNSHCDMHYDLPVYRHSWIIGGGQQPWLWALGLLHSPASVIFTAKRSRGRPMLQRRNEPSPTPIPGAITYSIKFVVSSPVIVMNAQRVQFFVSRSHARGDGGGWQSGQVDWIPCCRWAKRWRLMMQARTKALWMRRESGTRCVSDTGPKKKKKQK